MISFGSMDFQVGNLTYVMIDEEATERALRDFVKGVKAQGGSCPKKVVDQFLRYEDIDYFLLPKYMQNILDEIEVY